MKTTFNKLMLLATCMLLSLKTLAYDFEVDGIYYNILSEKDKTVEVTKNENEYADSCYSGNVIIPENVKYNNESYGIIRIGFEAFSNCSSLTSVTIPNSVTTIESLAFFFCYSLKSVTFGKSVETIGNSIFSGCESLTEILVNEDNTTFCSIDGVLYSKDMTLLHTYPCGKKENVFIIPEGVTTVGYNAFRNCISLNSITIPNSVTTIEGYAFSNCSSLTFINIPNNVKAIESCTFYMCQSLGSVTIGNNVKTIGESAFYKCSSLTSITIPKCVTSIGIEAFNACN